MGLKIDMLNPMIAVNKAFLVEYRARVMTEQERVRLRLEGLAGMLEIEQRRKARAENAEDADRSGRMIEIIKAEIEWTRRQMSEGIKNIRVSAPAVTLTFKGIK